MNGPLDLDRLRQFGLMCEDPDCPATHVDLETLRPGPVFTEDEVS